MSVKSPAAAAATSVLFLTGALCCSARVLLLLLLLQLLRPTAEPAWMAATAPRRLPSGGQQCRGAPARCRRGQQPSVPVTALVAGSLVFPGVLPDRAGFSRLRVLGGAGNQGPVPARGAAAAGVRPAWGAARCAGLAERCRRGASSSRVRPRRLAANLAVTLAAAARRGPAACAVSLSLSLSLAFSSCSQAFGPF